MKSPGPTTSSPPHVPSGDMKGPPLSGSILDRARWARGGVIDPVCAQLLQHGGPVDSTIGYFVVGALSVGVRSRAPARILPRGRSSVGKARGEG